MSFSLHPPIIKLKHSAKTSVIKQTVHTPCKISYNRIISPSGFDDYFDYFDGSPFKTKKSVRFSQTVRICFILSRHHVDDAAYKLWWDLQKHQAIINSELVKSNTNVICKKVCGILFNDTKFLLYEQTHGQNISVLDFNALCVETWLNSRNDVDAVTIESPIQSAICIRRNRIDRYASLR